jgi:Ala-tRNA(Pro) deacylase
MSMFDQLVALFTQHDAHFRVIEHPAEGRSDLVAEVRGTTVAQGAKAIVCEIEEAPLARYALAVVPGDRKVNIGRKGHFAKPEVAEGLTGCVIGSIPPLSFNRELRLLVNAGLLTREEAIAFSADRLDRSIVIHAHDYRRIAAPLVSDIAK